MHRLLRIFINEDRRKGQVLVVIWGVHSPGWMAALKPSAPVWKKIPRVGAVINRSSRLRGIPWGALLGRRVVVIPLMEKHILWRPKRYPALVGSVDAIDILCNKMRFAAYAGQQELSHLCPQTYPSVEEAEFPCVIKRADLSGGMGIQIAETLERARHLLSYVPFAGSAYIVQECVPFLEEYVAHCVCVKGRVVWGVVYSYGFEQHEIRRDGTRYKLGRRELPREVLEALEAFLAPLDYSGPCNADYVFRANGRLVIFEINPRLGGSLMFPQNVEDLAACLEVLIEETGKLPAVSVR